MGDVRTGAAGRVRDYLRWKPRRRPAGRQIVVSAVVSGVLFTVAMSLYDGLTDSWDEVSAGSVLFRFTSFTLLMIGSGFLLRPPAPAGPGSASPPGG